MTRHANRKKAARALQSANPGITYTQARLTLAADRSRTPDGDAHTEAPTAVGVVDIEENSWPHGTWYLNCTRCPMTQTVGPLESAVATAIRHAGHHPEDPADDQWVSGGDGVWRLRPETEAPDETGFPGSLHPPYTASVSPADFRPGNLFDAPEEGESVRLERAEIYEAGTTDDDYVFGIRVTGVYERTGKSYRKILSEDVEVEVWTERSTEFLASPAGLFVAGLLKPSDPRP